MRWIIGVDLRSGDVPIRFARWISETSRAPDGEQLVFVHVLEEEHLRFVLRQHHMDEVTEGARREAERLRAAAPEGAPRVARRGCDEWAEQQRAPLLVSGSRRLSGAERIVHSSTGSSLAATAATAVAVVPP